MRIPEFSTSLPPTPAKPRAQQFAYVGIKIHSQPLFPPFFWQSQVLYACQHLSDVLTCFFPLTNERQPSLPSLAADFKHKAQPWLNSGMTNLGWRSLILAPEWGKHTWRPLITPQLTMRTFRIIPSHPTPSTTSSCSNPALGWDGHGSSIIISNYSQLILTLSNDPQSSPSLLTPHLPGLEKHPLFYNFNFYTSGCQIPFFVFGQVQILSLPCLQ